MGENVAYFRKFYTKICEVKILSSLILAGLVVWDFIQPEGELKIYHWNLVHKIKTRSVLSNLSPYDGFGFPYFVVVLSVLRAFDLVIMYKIYKLTEQEQMIKILDISVE